jgi:hypothetical protein
VNNDEMAFSPASPASSVLHHHHHHHHQYHHNFNSNPSSIGMRMGMGRGNLPTPPLPFGSGATPGMSRRRSDAFSHSGSSPSRLHPPGSATLALSPHPLSCSQPAPSGFRIENDMGNGNGDKTVGDDDGASNWSGGLGKTDQEFTNDSVMMMDEDEFEQGQAQAQAHDYQHAHYEHHHHQHEDHSFGGGGGAETGPGAKNSDQDNKAIFSMGFRADCGMCHDRVPGHFSHVAKA